MLANYATFRQSMRIMMEGIMRTMSKVKKSVNVSLPPRFWKRHVNPVADVLKHAIVVRRSDLLSYLAVNHL